jgi:hypothetical protein
LTCTPSWLAIARTSAMTAACSGCVPCEKFSRTTLTPARKSSRSVFGSRDDGPIVATILVRLVIRESTLFRLDKSALTVLRSKQNSARRPSARMGQREVEQAIDALER